MAVIRPFRAIRPSSDKAKLVAALPYDVFNYEEALECVLDNPYSFLRVDKAEVELDPCTDHYCDDVYCHARDNLCKMIQDGILIQDDSPCLYVYRLTMNGRDQTGLVACTSINEYLDGIIKKHEHTRNDKEQDRVNHTDYCNANTGPIFIAYKQNAVSEIIKNYTLNKESIYDFISDDGIGHTVWIIEDLDTINALVLAFKSIPSLYIADGHHRNAAAVKVGLKRREEKGSYTGEEEFNYYLSVLFPSDELKILDYNRVVKDLNSLNEHEFIDKIKEGFVLEKSSSPIKPERPHDIGMYINRSWYKLTAKTSILKQDPVSRLDVSILQDNILMPILGINDIKTDTRIDFVGGIRGLAELTKRVDSGEMAIAFAMYPTSIDDLMDIADLGEIMPPKSTWFEPKLRSGLFIHSLS